MSRVGHFSKIFMYEDSGIHCWCWPVTKSCPTLCGPHAKSTGLQRVGHDLVTEQRWTVSFQASLSSAVSWNLLRFMSIESVMLSDHLILCCPLLLLPSIFPSIRVFSNESALPIRWPKHWSFSNSPSDEYSGQLPLGLTGLISLQSKGLSGVLSSKWLKW